jgi:hypothetical protein
LSAFLDSENSFFFCLVLLPSSNILLNFARTS